MCSSFTNFLESNFGLNLQLNLNKNLFQTYGREVIFPWKLFLSVWPALSGSVNLSWKCLVFFFWQGSESYAISLLDVVITQLLYITKLRRRHLLGVKTFLTLCFWFLTCSFACSGMAWTASFCATRPSSSRTSPWTRTVNSSFPTSWVMTPFLFLNMQRETQVRGGNVSNQPQFPCEFCWTLQ